MSDSVVSGEMFHQSKAKKLKTYSNFAFGHSAMPMLYTFELQRSVKVTIELPNKLQIPAKHSAVSTHIISHLITVISRPL